MYQFLLVTVKDEIAFVTINRPEKLNALNNMVLIELGIAFSFCLSNLSIKGIVITGSGTKAFSVGADIAEFKGMTSADAHKRASLAHLIFEIIETSPKPVIAAVNGFAMGGGCELAMCCHVRFAAENAIFAQPEINLALIPGFGGTQRLTNLIGKGRAMQMILSGALINVSKALDWGLVNEIVKPEQLLETCTSWFKKISTLAPHAVAKAIYCIQQANTPNGFQEEIKQFASCFHHPHTTEGIQAFLEKRTPNFE